MSLHRYLAQDRLASLASATPLAARSVGAVLLVDVAGFSADGARLARELGDRDGAEALACRLDVAYESLVAVTAAWRGSVIGFAGDAMLCWFARGEQGSRQAVRCAAALQAAAQRLDGVAVKVVVCSGRVERLAVGDPSIQWLDVVAGEPVDRLGIGETLARPGEILVDDATRLALGGLLHLRETRRAAQGVEFTLVDVMPGTGRTPVGLQMTGRVDATLLRPWILPAVHERERAGLGMFLMELRPIVALFVHFEVRPREADATRSKLDEVVGCLQALADRHGGALLQVTLGDKGSYAYVCFGAPSTHEDDAQRALACAWQSRDALHGLGGVEGIRLGLAAGAARAGAYGSAGRATYGAVGDCTNVAASLMGGAGPGQILVAPELEEAAAGAFEIAPAAPRIIKGRSDPVQPWALASPRRSGAYDRSSRHEATPLYGRDAELARIRNALLSTQHGAGRSLRIVGAPGIGKTRLVDEVLRQARGLGYRIAAGSCAAVHAQSAYFPWKPILRTLLGVDQTLGQAADSTRLHARFAALVPARLKALPVLRAVLDVPLEDNELTASLAPEGRGELLACVVEELLAATAARAPLMIVLEDAHACDPASAALLARCERSLRASAICLVVSSRSRSQGVPGVPDGGGTAHRDEIELGALDADSLQLLARARVAADAGSGACAERTLALLCTRAEGNPLHLVELLAFARQRGLLAQEMAHLPPWLPESLHALVLSRIDLLSESQRALLKAASVAGNACRLDWLNVLAPSATSERDARALLGELDALELTRADPTDEGSFAFRNAIVRDVAYASMSLDVRTQLHERLAHALEQRSPTRDRDLIAHHYGLGRDEDKQRLWFERACLAAHVSHANETALGWCDRLLPLLATAPERFEVLLRKAAILDLTGQRAEAAAAALQAQAHAQALGTHAQARSAHLLGRLHDRMDFEAAKRHFTNALALWPRAGDVPHEIETLNCLVAVHLLQAAIPAARALADHASTQIAGSTDRALIATVQEVFALVALYEGPPEAARQAFRLALAEAPRTDRRRRARLHANLAYLERRSGRWTTALRNYERGHALAEEIGFANVARVCLLGRATVLVDLGHAERARPLLEASLRRCRETGTDLPTLCDTLASLGACAMDQGDLDRAQEVLDEGLALARSAGCRWTQLAQNLGCVHLLRGDLARAGHCFHVTLEQLREIADPWGIAHSLIDHSDLACRGGRMREAVMLALAGVCQSRASGVMFAATTSRDLARTLGVTRQALPRSEYLRLRRAGLALSRDAAIELALGVSAPQARAA